MTDNEIIKALECCGKPVNEECCSECPYHLGGEENCHKLLGDIIDLINHKQAENEELRIENQSLRAAANSYKMHYNEAKSEAYKEFASRVKQELMPYDLGAFSAVRAVLKDLTGEDTNDLQIL